MVPLSYDGSDDDKKVETILAYDENVNNNNHIVVRNLESDDEVKEHLFEAQREDEIEETPSPYSLQKWCEL